MNDNNIITHRYIEFRYIILGTNGNFLEKIETPVHYIQGTDNDVFPTIEKALNGCVMGDRVRVAMTAEESYGQSLKELIHIDNINNVPPQYRKVGAQVEFQSNQGDKREFQVTKIKNGKVTLDGNHPLAGKDLTFLIEVTSARDATDDEIKQGHGIDPSTIMH
jgi:FKBP-type peptidyl-prolyl cis-trans isomerase SlyD